MEDKNFASNEALYTKILIIATAFMLAFVLFVFGFVSRHNGDEDQIPVGTDGQSGEVTEAPDAPVVYLPSVGEDVAAMSGSYLDAEYAVLVDCNNNCVIAAQGASERIYPASMTKIMTILVAVEQLGDDLDATFTMTRDIVDSAYAAGASVAGFAIGEKITARDLLYGAALPSGADATDALAILAAGSEQAFVVLMNEKAHQLGLKNTRFVNSSGLHDDNHYSTPIEIATIMAYAMENELCAEILSARSYTTASTPQHPEGITLYSTAFARMSTDRFGSVNLVAAKTGYTDEARFCLASYGESADGGRYVLVTAYGSDKYAPVYDCKYAYESFID